jgi:ATP-dependent Clp protease ATP-binding subunit ClpC
VSEPISTQELSFQPSRRATRIAGTAWLVARWRQNLLIAAALVSFVSAISALLLNFTQMAVFLAIAGLVFAPLAFWSKWGMLQFVGLSPVADGLVNLSELLTADLVRPLKKAKDTAALWSAVRGHWQAEFLVRHLGIPVEAIDDRVNSLDLEQVYQAAYQAAKKASQRHITAGSLVVACTGLVEAKQPILAGYHLTQDDLNEGLVWLEHLIHDRLESHERKSYGGIGRDFAAGYTNFLDRFGANMSDEVEAGAPVFSSVGRESVVDSLIAALNQSVHPAAALVGPTGVGKSTLVYALTDEILNRPDVGRLAYRKVMRLSASALLSAVTPELPIERIMNEVMNDAVRAKNVVIFFDEAQSFFTNKPGAVDISEILTPILQQTRLPMIFAFTEEDWTRFAQLRPNLIGQITKLVVPELDRVALIRVLEDVALNLENQTGQIATLAALKETVNLSDRYTNTKQQPGAGIDLLRSAFSNPQSGMVTEQSIQAVIEKTTGVKTGTAKGAEAEQLLNLEELIHQRMINQSQAVSSVAAALRRARAGVKDTKRPIGSFLFLGPTGVGKTELAKSLAATYFGGEEKMVRLDMSEYQQASDVGRLLAAASESGSGSSFLEHIRLQPYGVVLLDEIEKAHPDILNLILQLLDEGRLTDTAGKAVSFKDCIIILTSNALADDIRRSVSEGKDLAQLHDQFIDKMISEQIFKPELLNRFDEIVTFRPLTPDELVQVVTIMLRSLNKNLSNQQITIELTDAAKAYVVEVGNDPRMGARPMRRTLQKLVEDRLSKRLLKGEIQSGQVIVLDRKDIELA